ncbi:hypothetical protein AYO42_04425 [Rhizomicrobium sp. SCGC AG-212-E05]|nr:hypothetical protein AYO42_04425 [Rhizomicrobium sp. SCGC AG-212-E05]
MAVTRSAILRWAQRLSVVLVGAVGGFVAAFATFAVITGPMAPPYGNCFHDYRHDLPPALGPGAPQSKLVKIAIAYVRKSKETFPVRLKDTRVEVQDWGDHWKVHFPVPADKDFWGCEIMRFDGNGLTVEIRKQDMQPYKIDIYG